MNCVIDLDLENRWSWQGALDMVFALCNRAADLSFDCRMLGGKKTPVVEFRLDAPAELTLPQVTEQAHASVETWTNGTVVLTNQMPSQLPEGTVYLLRPNGAAAVTYRAFKEAVRVLTQLGIPAEFSWSSIPLAPLCDDIALLFQREQACYTLGAVHTLWLHCQEDALVQTAMRSMLSCGQLRVQNMTTANTWIVGKTDEQALLQSLANREPSAP